MKVIALFGAIVFGAFALLSYKLGAMTYKEEKEGEMQISPSWIGFGLAICSFVVACLFIIYLLGLWDAFIEWGQFGEKKPFVIQQY